MLRRFVEDTLVVKDRSNSSSRRTWRSTGSCYPLVYGSDRRPPRVLQGRHDDPMLTSFMPEWHDEAARWIDAVVKAAAAESEENRS